MCDKYQNLVNYPLVKGLVNLQKKFETLHDLNDSNEKKN